MNQFNSKAVLYYWRGKGTIGALVRHSSSSPWAHVAVGISVAGLPCYFESYPRSGFRLVPIEGDQRPDAYQALGVKWTDEAVHRVMLDMSRRQYSGLNGILTMAGINRKSNDVQCAQAAMMILVRLGIPIRADLVPEPGAVALEVERITRNPVRLEF